MKLEGSRVLWGAPIVLSVWPFGTIPNCQRAEVYGNIINALQGLLMKTHQHYLEAMQVSSNVWHCYFTPANDDKRESILLEYWMLGNALKKLLLKKGSDLVTGRPSCFSAYFQQTMANYVIKFLLGVIALGLWNFPANLKPCHEKPWACWKGLRILQSRLARMLHHECDALESYVFFCGGTCRFTVFRAWMESCLSCPY